MNATARKARQEIRTMRRVNRKLTVWDREALSGRPCSVKAYLVHVGMDFAVAERFASAFSRGMVAQDRRTVDIKLRGRRTKRVDVKLYDRRTLAARLAAYRPKDADAAAEFERVAA
jgi:hypothetical protein